MVRMMIMVYSVHSATNKTNEVLFCSYGEHALVGREFGRTQSYYNGWASIYKCIYVNKLETTSFKRSFISWCGCAKILVSQYICTYDSSRLGSRFWLLSPCRCRQGQLPTRHSSCCWYTDRTLKQDYHSRSRQWLCWQQSKNSSCHIAMQVSSGQDWCLCGKGIGDFHQFI
jgi:hypothetical protein